MDQLTVIVAGQQGSGKDTQVELLKEYLHKHDPDRPVVHFDAGARLREFAHEDGFTHNKVRVSMTNGELQPMFVLAHVMSKFFISSMQGNEHLFVSGFPRSLDQMLLFTSAITFYERKDPVLLFLNVPENVSIERLLKRGRHDDTEESIRKRLHWTQHLTMPVIEEFRTNHNYKYIEIDATRSVEEVHKNILQKFNLS